MVRGATASELALATSELLYDSSPAVVLVADGDVDDLVPAAQRAVALGVPLLLTPSHGDSPTLRAELARLKPDAVQTFGSAAQEWAQTVPASPSGAPASADPAETWTPRGINDEAVLSTITPAEPLTDLLVLTLKDAKNTAAAATAEASGAQMLTLTNADPRVSATDIKALASHPAGHVLGIGAAFGPADRLSARAATASTGVMLPGGGQVVFPYRRMVALYGHPGDTILGSLGEQPLGAAIVRAKKVAASYASLTKQPVVPVFEIITTVASASAGSDGNYSNEVPLAKLRPWVKAAGDAGIYVILDLQPGRTDFLTQAKLYTEFLKLPYVGLALDPEWRLKPGQRHMVQIGSVPAAEINATSAWLAELTAEQHLPQKVFVVHQFRLDMITDRATLNTSHDELQMVIHVDGFGSPSQKLDTWRAIRSSAPANIWWGWKNFYDEDTPTFTPAQTNALRPSPVLITYQ